MCQGAAKENLRKNNHLKKWFQFCNFYFPVKYIKKQYYDVVIILYLWGR